MSVVSSHLSLYFSFYFGVHVHCYLAWWWSGWLVGLEPLLGLALALEFEFGGNGCAYCEVGIMKYEYGVLSAFWGGDAPPHFLLLSRSASERGWKPRQGVPGDARGGRGAGSDDGAAARRARRASPLLSLSHPLNHHTHAHLLNC